MLTVDGARESGSGTVLRTAVVIAAVTGQDLKVRNIRQNRPHPGLRPQHLTVLQAIAELTDGGLEGADVGSSSIRFTPRKSPRGGERDWDIQTAGSVTLLAGALMPLALYADRESHFHLSGGVFQDFAPSGFHTQYALIPLLRRMGADLDMEIVRPGYFPKGNGVAEVSVQPLQQPLRALKLTSRGRQLRGWGIALSSHLDKREVSERLAESALDFLEEKDLDMACRVLYDHTAPQPGAALALFAEDEEGIIIGSDMAGARGRRSEDIGHLTARNLWQQIITGATVDVHLADQLILPAALAQGTTSLLIPRMTDHMQTNLWLVEELLGAKASVDDNYLHIDGIGLKG